MKKLAVVTLVVLAFSGIGYAQDIQFKMSGFIDVIAEWNKNTPQTASAWGMMDWMYATAFTTLFDPNLEKAWDKTRAYMEGRFRLRFDAMLGKEVTGTIHFEGDAERWGLNTTSTGQQRNRLGTWGADRAGVEVKHYYISFGVPYFGIPVPITVSAGVQYHGIRPGMYGVTDGPGVIVSAAVDPAKINFHWFKVEENEDWAADDADVYAVEASYKYEALTFGGYLSYWNMNSYPIGTPTQTSSIGINNPPYRANFWWLGLYADGKLGPVNLMFDFLYDNGKVKGRGANTVYDDVKYSGWVVRGKVDYPWEMFNFGFVGMYATGADADKTSPYGRPGATGDEKVKCAVVPPTSENGWGDTLIFYGNGIANRMNTGYGRSSAGYVSPGMYGGTWFAQLYAGWKMAPCFKATLMATYIGDTTKHGNSVGFAVKGDGLRDDKTIGWEFDLINEIQIYKNLKWVVGLGYLIAGKALDAYYVADDKNKSPDNPWAVATSLTYSF